MSVKSLNTEIKIALEYHNETKHPYGNLLRKHVHYSNLVPFKKYNKSKKVILQLKISKNNKSVFETLSVNRIDNNIKSTLNLTTLTRIIYFSASLTKKYSLNSGKSLSISLNLN